MYYVDKKDDDEENVTYRSSKLDDRNLHAQANPKVRNLVLSSILCSQYHTSYPTIPKSTRNQDACCILQKNNSTARLIKRKKKVK